MKVIEAEILAFKQRNVGWRVLQVSKGIHNLESSFQLTAKNVNKYWNRIILKINDFEAIKEGNYLFPDNK